MLFSSFLAEIVTAVLTFMTWLWISNLSIASFLGVFKMRQARDPCSAWVWVSLHVCFPFNRSLLLFCRTSSIKVNQFNIFQYYSISLYHHIMSFHVISYLPSFFHAWPTSQAGSVDWHALLHQMPADVFTSVTALELRSTEITLADFVF